MYVFETRWLGKRIGRNGGFVLLKRKVFTVAPDIATAIDKTNQETWTLVAVIRGPVLDKPLEVELLATVKDVEAFVADNNNFAEDWTK